MSDLDAVLERLLGDPSFAASLAADPARALAGYRLDADDLQLLSAQLSSDAGGQHTVESRTSQASMFGLLAPLAGVAGFGPAPDTGQSGFGAASARAGFGAAEAARSGFGPAETSGFGAPDDADGTVLDMGFGAADPASGADPAVGAAGVSPPQHALPPPTDYKTRVDVDGDGDWDRHWYARRADGGVDIMADMDGDGRADFIGHDYNRDGRVDAADYDRDRDGQFGTHLFDDDGDGWLDRKIVSPGDS